MKKPKVFISYSWNSTSHQEQVREWADRLINDGVDVIMDIYDLKEGQDKFAFMERMINDSTVSHVLIFSDKRYSEKANERKAGVGTESQIISMEVYEKIDQTKFIPIACEFDESREPYLPTFIRSRIWIDFSSPEKVNENWEKLIRHLYGKPLHVKPETGEAPIYIREEIALPSSPVNAKFNTLRQSILQGKKGINLYRREFLEACLEYVASLRIRKRPDVDSLGEKVLEDCGKLKFIRDFLIDWILLESETAPNEGFYEKLQELLENLIELKSRPGDLHSWNDAWFEAHRLFVYETFLYMIAALLKLNSFETLHSIFTSAYLLPETERSSVTPLGNFSVFYAHSDTLQDVLAPKGKRLNSPAAELIKKQADREDIPFSALFESELLVFMMALITPNAYWCPQTLYYAPYNHQFSFFLRASHRKYFTNLAVITGILDVDILRESLRMGYERLGVKTWYEFHHDSLLQLMNFDKLDSIK